MDYFLHGLGGWVKLLDFVKLFKLIESIKIKVELTERKREREREREKKGKREMSPILESG